ncbi:divergent polysaccharide deacetylase family protein [Lentibacter algarum]|uniref:divergent polysaccharide deacetylase family protein n=1 Tax=Lentibacter algarum TaxID=576131 RepID=UPI001C09BFC6|nr:divergent polysaccharide deacetylase family protein [Lentibacter algarum]
MARGILSGVILGTVTATVGVGALSLAVGPPQVGADASQPVVESQASPSSADAPQSATQSADVTSAEPAPDITEAPVVEAPDADSAIAVSPDETASAPAPDVSTGEAQEAAQAPEETAQPEISQSTDAPVTAAVDGMNAPDSEEAVAVETEAATPSEEPAEAETVATAEAEVEPQTEPQAEPQTEPLPDEAREEITLAVEPEEPQSEQTASVVAPKPAGTSIGTPAKTLGSSVSTRLPSVQSSSGQPADNAEVSAAETDDGAKPLQRFAADFEPAEGKPKMAIVLIDDGTSNIGVEALTTFPYPLSFAVDTSWKGAKDAMAVYRAAGFEVLAMIDLPRGARASDVEVAMPVLLDTVPEAVGVMETPDAGLQESRDVSGQVSEYLANSGHGLLLFPKGLNTASKLAAKEGVPTATVFRDFDSKGQNASSIKRFLSHAALKAGSEGGVVMVGRLRGDTISALLLWGLQDRSDQLQLAPISQIMKAQN